MDSFVQIKFKCFVFWLINNTFKIIIVVPTKQKQRKSERKGKQQHIYTTFSLASIKSYFSCFYLFIWIDYTHSHTYTKLLWKTSKTTHFRFKITTAYAVNPVERKKNGKKASLNNTPIRFSDFTHIISPWTIMRREQSNIKHHCAVFMCRCFLLVNNIYIAHVHVIFCCCFFSLFLPLLCSKDTVYYS